MRYSFLLIITLFLSFFAHNQKANSYALRVGYNYLRYPERENVSTPLFALSVSEDYSIDGVIPARTYATPNLSDPRGSFYLSMVPKEGLFFSQAKDLSGNMALRNEDFTEIKIYTGDIRFSNQNEKKSSHGNKSGEYMYSLEFDVSVLVEIEIRKRGTNEQVVLEKKEFKSLRMNFPSNVVLNSSMTDVQKNGFSSQAALMEAWNKYKNYAALQWRGEVISASLKPTFAEYKERFMLYETRESVKVFSDKNKKGGFEDVVIAGDNYIGVFESVKNDYKEGINSKHWTKEYQEQLNSSVLVWEKFLKESNFNITANDKLISDDYRQKIMFNYIQGLIMTGQFELADKFISDNVNLKLKPFTLQSLGTLKSTLDFEKSQFEKYAISKEWVRLSN